MKTLFAALTLFMGMSSAHAEQVQINDSPGDADGWFDITVLRAYVKPDTTLEAFNQVEHCNRTYDFWGNLGWGGSHHKELFDCSGYIGSRLNATAFKAFPNWEFLDGQLQSWNGLLDTPVAVVETVVPLDRLERATHIGFSLSSQGGVVNVFIANGLDGQTKEVEKVTLKDGRVGVVHRWVAPFSATGQTGGLVIRSLPFKPVLIRWNGNTQTRYWDRLIGTGMFQDYSFNNTQWSENAHDYLEVEPAVYDRTAELLK